MGMVIDLTNLDRYYDKRELTDDKNINHYKLQCEGFGEIPTMEQVGEFKRVCSHFFAHHPEEIIGVHCTHGYNRTGFLLISHLVEADNWGLEAALATFAQARPPGVYKQDFLDVLSHCYGDDQQLIASLWPAWCEEGERCAEGNEHYKSARFMEGVSGVECVGPPTREDVQRQCQHILQWECGGFPGSQPVSMDVRNISLLHKKPYRVSCKADGTRYMMYIRGRGEVYMLNRSDAVFRVPYLSFPSGRHLGEHLTETLLDGEMVIAKNKDGSSKPCYLIYDIIQFESSTEVALRDHNVRMVFVSKEVVEPRDKALLLHSCTVLLSMSLLSHLVFRQ
ncbi:mRNA-capping enzyme-like isoform X2 [Halichondria panicea]|uniref:mRNA-capping enzyme-like isoform X2 n=1 Tax=Halichondria panicea TaxID=6063 RepID=UPI00312B36BD